MKSKRNGESDHADVRHTAKKTGRMTGGFIKISALLYLTMMFQFASSQSVHFSQFFNSPLTVNPANTGFMPDADYRVGVNYRNQWSSVMAVPYKTISVFGDAQVLRNKLENGWLGLGGIILKDVAGSGQLSTTGVYSSIAYHQMLGYSSLLSLGFNAGWVNKRINAADLRFPDQFDGKFFSTKIPTDVALDAYSVSYMDIKIGMNYAYFPNEKIYLNGGFSAWYVNRPRESFFETGISGFDSRIPRRYIGFLNSSIKLNEQVIVNPMAYYTRQTTASEFTAGANLQYNLGNGGEMQLIAGAYYRNNDAIIPMIGLVIKSIRVFFSYDATTSSLSKYNATRGALEFALLNYGVYSNYNGSKRQSLCPVFKK